MLNNNNNNNNNDNNNIGTPFVHFIAEHAALAYVLSLPLHSGRSRIFRRGVQVQANYCNSTRSYIMCQVGVVEAI